MRAGIHEFKRARGQEGQEQEAFFSSKILNFNFVNCFYEEIKKKHPILLVLPIEKIIIQPELSSPPRFRIQGGVA